MPSSQSTTFTDDSLKQKTNKYAQLQAMGIDIFVPIQQLDVAQQPWIDSLCKILNISREDCLFDAKQPAFDNQLKKLHLPASTVASEGEIKKLIWQSIRQFVT